MKRRVRFSKSRGINIAQRWFLVIIAFVFALSPQTLSALSAAREGEFAEYGIIFYDPDEDGYCPPGSALNSNNVNGSSVVLIGDSISNRSRTQLATEISGINIIAQDSKQFAGPDNESNPTGLQMLQSLALQQPIIVFALGTNNAGLTSADVERAIELAGSARQVLFVTNYKLGSPTYYDSNNNLMKQAAQTHSNVAIADWAAAVSSSGNPEQYIDTTDGYNVHPSPEGETLFARTIATALTQFVNINTETVSSTVVAEGSDNASVLLGFLISKGYTHQSAAAIAGNLQAESSGINPLRFEAGVGNDLAYADEGFRAIDSNGNKTFTGGFGIVQWTSAGRVQSLQNFADQNNLPVVSLEAQMKYMAVELTQYGYDPSVLNSMSFEEATFAIFRFYLTPCSSLARDQYGCDNDYSPSAYSGGSAPLDQARTPAAYAAFTRRHNFAREFLGLSPVTSHFGNCVGSYSAWSGDNFPVYLQCDARWGSLRFGSGGIYGSTGSTICAAGCGPSSFAMMATALLGGEITPADTSDIAGKAGIYVPGSGSSWDVTRVLAEHYGLQYEVINTTRATVVEDVSEYLRQGWMVHSSGGGNYGSGAAPYSRGGHYVGIRGITADGKWLIADSASQSRDQNKLWDPQEVLAAGMNIGNLRAIRR
jgi:hypothetical protein